MSGPESTTQVILEAHKPTFEMVATKYNVAIAVRATNDWSLGHVNKPYTAAKPIDCKAKTADRHAALNGRTIQCAGLVVAPDLLGWTVFGTNEKRKKMIEKIWPEFRDTLVDPNLNHEEALEDTDAKLTKGYRYFIEYRRKDPFYGCVKFAPGGYVRSAKAIHGDYDLYAIVPLDTAEVNVRKTGVLHGQPHAHGPLFPEISRALNAGMGRAMILHGSQEKYYPEHEEDTLGVFFPGKRMMVFDGKAEIERLYRTHFRGRRLFTKGAPQGAVADEYKAVGYMYT